MTNLLLANCGIPLTGTYTGSLTADSTYGIDSLFGGNKADFHRIATAASGDYRLTFIPFSAGEANFLYLGRADLLKAAGVGTITLKGHSSNNYAAATTVATVSSFGSAGLVGPQSDDYITTFATSSSYDYWFVNFNAASASKFPLAKLFFGSYFDPGYDPDTEVVLRRERPHPLRKRPLYTVELSWNGLSYANTVTMYNRFARPRRYNPVLLFTSSYHGLLSDHRVLFGRVLEMTMPPKVTGSNRVSMVFEEVL